MVEAAGLLPNGWWRRLPFNPARKNGTMQSLYKPAVHAIEGAFQVARSL